MMSGLQSRILSLACFIFAVLAAPCKAQQSSDTAPPEIQPERISLSRSSRPISGTYVCIEPCNLLTAYAPNKTIFHDLAPDAIGSFDTLETTRAVFLKQSIKTTALGNAELSEKAIGEDARKYPDWLWKGLLITLCCSIAGFLLFTCLKGRKRAAFSTWQLVIIFVPLMPFLLLLLILGFMSMVGSSVPDPRVDIYVDNATRSAYEIILNGERVSLPPESHICLNIRPRDHDLRVKKKSSGEETRFAVSSAFKEGETYLINLEGANRYEVIHKAYSLY